MSEYNPICANGVLNISASAGWCKTLGLGTTISKWEERRAYKSTWAPEVCLARGGGRAPMAATASAGISPSTEMMFKVPSNLNFQPQSLCESMRPQWVPSQLLSDAPCVSHSSLIQRDAAALALRRIWLTQQHESKLLPLSGCSWHFKLIASSKSWVIWYFRQQAVHGACFNLFLNGNSLSFKVLQGITPRALKLICSTRS